jgi:hypothetical protein
MNDEGEKKEGNKHFGFLCLRTHKEHIFSFKKKSISRKASNNPFVYLFNI